MPLFSEQGSLERFDAHDCTQLEDVSGLQELQCLRIVNVSGCKKLKSLGELSSTCLSELYVAGTAISRSEVEAHFQVGAIGQHIYIVSTLLLMQSWGYVVSPTVCAGTGLHCYTPGLEHVSVAEIAGRSDMRRV